MSDSEYIDIEDQNNEFENIEQEEVDKSEKPKPVMKPVKKQDKRSITSRINLAKARNRKIEMLKQQKELEKYQIDDSDESESDDEIVIKPRKKTGKGKIKFDPIVEELAELRNMIYQLAQSKSKPKKKPTKIVQVIKEQETKREEPKPKKEETPEVKNLRMSFFD